MTVRISLTQGQFALIDDEELARVGEHKWWAIRRITGRFYAQGWIGGKRTFLHNFIMPPPEGMEIDHIDHNGLNCQKENMRPATHAENNANKSASRNNKSGFKGVDWHNGKHRATIGKDGKHYHIGYFETPEEAAHAYDEAAKAIHGEFASLNFPLDNL